MRLDPVRLAYASAIRTGSYNRTLKRLKRNSSSVKRTSKSSKSAKTSKTSSIKLIKDVDEVDLDDGGEAASEAAVELLPPEEDLMLIQEIQAAKTLINSSPLREHDAALITPVVDWSNEQLSLPEVLVYYSLLTRDISQFPCQLRLVSKMGHDKHVLRLQIIEEVGQKRRELYRLFFHKRKRQAKVFKGKKCVGVVHYLVRSGRLEEVQGFLFGHYFLIDPVWKKGKYDYETFRIGAIKTELFSRKSGPEGRVVSGEGDAMAFTLNHFNRYSVSGALFAIYKGASLGTLDIQERLVFHKRLMVPIRGVMTLSGTLSKTSFSGDPFRLALSQLMLKQ